jgi:hypothetical protein
MNKLIEPSRILMTRQSLESFPILPVPAGFTLRWYEPGFEEHWLAIHLAAEKEIPISPELFTRRFGSDPAVLAARQCYLFSADCSPVGTVTGWLDPDFEGAPHARVEPASQSDRRDAVAALWSAVFGGAWETAS